jgi:peptidyl-prolyl cis-trans isomerase B (cyclophilin B)
VQAPLGSSPRETRPARKAPPRLARALREAAMKRARRRRNLLAFGTVGLASVIVAVAVVIGALVDRAGDAAGTVTTTRPPNNALAAIACGGKTPKPVQRRTFSKAPATVIKDSATYDAIVKTSCGTFTIRLDANKAPKTVNSIVYLARARFYDSTRFHRIVPGGAANIGIIQGGDPAGDGSGGPGYQLPDEFPPAASAYVKYTVAMASSGPGTTGSQFFVNFQDNSRMLQPSYTLVGRVIDGKDVVDKIAKISVAGPHGDIPSQAVWIERMTVRETLAR